MSRNLSKNIYVSLPDDGTSVVALLYSASVYTDSSTGETLDSTERYELAHGFYDENYSAYSFDSSEGLGFKIPIEGYVLDEYEEEDCEYGDKVTVRSYVYVLDWVAISAKTTLSFEGNSAYCRKYFSEI